jgi:exodeoxyribonuclease VII large subunit
LIQALAALNALRPRPEVLLLVRGGGSIEDLWAFNDEKLVRAVAASESPVICGVGHETDFTLSDFVADVRAPTPTAAAELATPVTVSDLRDIVNTLRAQLGALVAAWLAQRRSDGAAAANGLRYVSPWRRIQSDRQRLDDFSRRVLMAQSHQLALQLGELNGWRQRLQALSPTEVIGRGYAIVTRRVDGALVRKVEQAHGGIHVRVSDGGFDAEVVGKPG